MLSLSQYTLAAPLYESTGTILYRGYRNADREPVVVKVLRAERPTPSELAKLRHEFAITRSLERFGAVKVHGLEKYGDSLALIMEEFQGQSLHALLRAQRLDLADILKLFAAIARTLASVHSQRIIHGDIKPHNILVNPSTHEVKLIDFGIATRLVKHAPQTRSVDALEGTLAYISPEQTGRMARAIDQRSDLYSLGVTLYEALTGVPPFPLADKLELVHSHCARIPVPPHQLAPRVARVVSDMVMKLLAKVPEDRYQSARGLQLDLEECSARLTKQGQIEPFPLGRHDQYDELRLPQKLYGMEAPMSTLNAALGRVGRGPVELVLVSGADGMGKSALVQAFGAAIRQQKKGHFAIGTLEHLNQSIPYEPWIQALGELVRQLLTERAEVLQKWKAKLLDAVGANGHLLINILPELELVLGPQPSVPEVGPAESRSRLSLIFQRFVRAFASAEHPLVLALDALEQTDLASMKLLQTLLSDPERGHMLVVCTYRDDAVGPGHPLHEELTALRKIDGIATTEIAMAPLSGQDVAHFVADTLGYTTAQVGELSSAVLAKTHGNPFFVAQLLKTLRDEESLRFDAVENRWTWDIARVHQAPTMDNVVALMTDKLRRLSAKTQSALAIAACFGDQFDLKSLSQLHARTPAQSAADLWEALREGLIVPLDAEYRLFIEGEPDASAEPSLPPGLNVSYKFLHARVHQAAYDLVDHDEKRRLHLQIGRMMRDAPDARGEDNLAAITHHLNAGVELMTDRSERVELARQNLTLGRAAKTIVAWESAARQLAAGVSALDASSWEREHELCFTLHAELAECSHLCGRDEEAEGLFNLLLSRAASILERAQVYEARIAYYYTRGKYQETLSTGLEIIRALGVDLPEAGPELSKAIVEENAAILALLGERPIAEIVNAPSMVDPEKRAVLGLLLSIAPAAYVINAALCSLMSMKQVHLSLEHGNADASAYGYLTYGLYYLAPVAKHYQQGYEFGALALALNERSSNLDLTSNLNSLFAASLPFFKHLRSTLPYLTRAYQAGIDSGAMAHLSAACFHLAMNRFWLGEDLASLQEDAEKMLALMQRTKNPFGIGCITIVRQLSACLQTGTRGRQSLSDESFDEEAFIAQFEVPALSFIACWYHLAKLYLAYIYDDFAGALAAMELADARKANAVGFYLATEVSFFACLTILAQPMIAPERRERIEALYAEHRARLGEWSTQCPENFRHKLHLVLAEEARVAGRDLEALNLYEQAIDGAERGAFLRDEALASELCARYHAAAGRKRAASSYLNGAYSAYIHWGASAKAAELTEKHQRLRHLSRRRETDTLTTSTSGWSSSGSTTDVLDVGALIRAAQAIAGEVELDHVLDRLMRTVIENAGAQRAVLMLNRDDQLMIAAAMTMDADAVILERAAPVESSDALAVSVAQYVARTGEAIVLGDATQGNRFASDPYIVAHKPRSLLCLSMTHQGRLTGVLYLENNIANNVFSQGRLELLRLLLSQAATAVENALLYAYVQRRNEELRTAEMRVEVELAERERAERARASLQDEIIQVQRDRLAEMSTPIIPILDGIMVMPLIGTIDAQRAQQTLETALNGVQVNRAQVVIIDITGVRTLDAETSARLMDTARALALLGAEAVITGMRPDVAQTLISLDIDMRAITTKGTLQSGVAHALARVGGLKRLRR